MGKLLRIIWIKEFLQESMHKFRGILQVHIHGNGGISACGKKSCGKRVFLAEIAGELNCLDAGILLVETCDAGKSCVRAAIVHKDDLKRVVFPLEDIRNTLVEKRNGLFFVEDRDYERNTFLGHD